MAIEPVQTSELLVPPGAWAVGVSGGADSVGLLSLVRGRPDLRLVAVHLDHETRGAQSTGDADFVRELCARWAVPCVVARRGELEPSLVDPPANASALFRALRLSLFQRVVRDERLLGVLLAHHADDQAETVLHRLLRGAGPAGLGGMRVDHFVAGVRIYRPLLGVRREAIRAYLQGIGQAWREDASNISEKYLRNRLRGLLADHPALSDALIQLAVAMGNVRDWLDDVTPTLSEQFNVRELRGRPVMVAAEAARRWLIACGAPRDDVGSETLGELLAMVEDAASPARRSFPGAIVVRRRGGMIFVENAPPKQ